MNRDEFEKAVWQTFDPVREINPEEALRAVIEQDRRKLTRWRLQIERAKAATARRMERYDSDPDNMLCEPDPSILDVADEEIDAAL